jgi:CRP/FNR family transcriptional regulator
MYVIASGQVRVYLATPAGDEMTVDILAAGDTVGEMEALEGVPRSANVATMTPCTLLSITREALLSCMDRNPTLGMHLALEACRQVRRTTDHARRVSLYGPRSRICLTLVDLGRRHGAPVESGLLIDLELTQTDLACLNGTTRETANRVLGELRDEGLVGYRGRRIVLRDPCGLRALALAAESGAPRADGVPACGSRPPHGPDSCVPQLSGVGRAEPRRTGCGAGMCSGPIAFGVRPRSPAATLTGLPRRHAP